MAADLGHVGRFERDLALDKNAKLSPCEGNEGQGADASASGLGTLDVV